MPPVGDFMYTLPAGVVFVRDQKLTRDAQLASRRFAANANRNVTVVEGNASLDLPPTGPCGTTGEPTLAARRSLK